MDAHIFLKRSAQVAKNKNKNKILQQNDIKVMNPAICQHIKVP